MRQRWKALLVDGVGDGNGKGRLGEGGEGEGSDGRSGESGDVMLGEGGDAMQGVSDWMGETEATLLGDIADPS